MKKHLWIMPLFFLVCFSGCAYRIDRAYYSDPETFVREANDVCIARNVRVLTKTGEQLLGTRCVISDSTISFRLLGSPADTAADNRDIEMISVRSHFHGALRSCLVGALTGAGVSALIGFLKSPSARNGENSSHMDLLLPTLTIGGGFAGIAAAAFLGIEIRIYLDPNRKTETGRPDGYIL